MSHRLLTRGNACTARPGAVALAALSTLLLPAAVAASAAGGTDSTYGAHAPPGAHEVSGAQAAIEAHAPPGAPALEIMWETRAPVPGARVVDFEVADLDADGLPDLLVTGVGRDGPWSTAAVAGTSGEVLWSIAHEGRALVRGLRSAEGEPRVAVVSGGFARLLTGRSGEAVASAPIRGVVGGVAVGDVDGDGVDDVVCASGFERDDVLVALSGDDLRELASARALADESRFGEGFGRLVVADLDGDGACDILASENLDSLTRIDPSGKRVWTVALDERTRWFPKGSITGGPAVADVTGEGAAHVCVGCLAGRLLVLDAAAGETLSMRRFGARSDDDSRRLARMPRALLAAISGSGEPVNGILAAELNGRPGAELVFGCSNGQVYAYAPSRGEELWRFESGETVHDRPVAIDWNGDGTLDVVAWDDESVHVIDGRTGEPLDGFPQLHRPDGVAVADLDGDGTLDIVGVERGARRLVAWRTTLRAPVGDAGVNDAPCGDERESGTR